MPSEDELRKLLEEQGYRVPRTDDHWTVIDTVFVLGMVIVIGIMFGVALWTR